MVGSTVSNPNVATITIGATTPTANPDEYRIEYIFELNAPLDHPITDVGVAGEDVLDLQFGVDVSDGSTTVQSNFTVTN